jgi:tetratricopeptide (TPR) repeat protein
MKIVLAMLLLLPALSASARRPDSIDRKFVKADSMIEAGDYATARRALDAALAELKTEDARMVRYHERTGTSWLLEGKVREARASFTAALKATQRLRVTDDSGARAYTGLALCLRREKKDAYALKFFKKALAFNLDEGTKIFAEEQIREIEGAAPAR